MNEKDKELWNAILTHTLNVVHQVAPMAQIDSVVSAAWREFQRQRLIIRRIYLKKPYNRVKTNKSINNKNQNPQKNAEKDVNTAPASKNFEFKEKVTKEINLESSNDSYYEYSSYYDDSSDSIGDVSDTTSSNSSYSDSDSTSLTQDDKKILHNLKLKSQIEKKLVKPVVRKKTPYNIFIKYQMQELKDSSLNNKEKIKAIAERWKNLTQFEKEKFIQAHADELSS